MSVSDKVKFLRQRASIALLTREDHCEKMFTEIADLLEAREKAEPVAIVDGGFLEYLPHSKTKTKDGDLLYLESMSYLGQILVEEDEYNAAIAELEILRDKLAKQVPDEFDPATWLWSWLADYCKRNGINPHHSDLFRACSDMRAAMLNVER